MKAGSQCPGYATQGQEEFQSLLLCDWVSLVYRLRTTSIDISGAWEKGIA